MIILNVNIFFAVLTNTQFLFLLRNVTKINEQSGNQGSQKIV